VRIWASQNLFGHELAAAIRRDRRKRAIFGQRFQAVGIDRTGRREDQFRYIIFDAHVDDVLGSRHVGAVIFDGFAYGFFDIQKRGQMNDGARVDLREDFFHRVDVQDIGLEETCRRGNGIARRVAEIVHHDHGNVAVEEVIDDLAADIAAAAGDQDGIMNVHTLVYRKESLAGRCPIC
jgi:hypothetical protein